MADSLFLELKRRKVFKVGIAYLVLSWVVVQVTSLAVPAMFLPEWVNSFIFFLVAIGFPFALFFAWAFEITPDGVKRESEIDLDESITHQTGRKIDFIIIGMLIVGLGYFIYESRFESQPDEGVLSAENRTEIDTYKVVAQKPEGSSIAVLPFVNMSDDKANEYFSDGISEEILNVLAKIPNLHVTSRSSAFSFRGKKIIISEVAKKLGVKNVLEGSVRKVGNRVRITAQLIDASSDKHLWSESYDRELTDIFAIQDEISSAIVQALKAKLGIEVKVANRDMSAVNLYAHNEYLQGRFLIENRNQADLEKAMTHFNKAIEIAPDYAPAWMGKGWAQYFLGETNYGDMPTVIASSKAKTAIEMALKLDPDLPEAHAVMGLITGDVEKAKAIAIGHFKRAIELNPNYADARIWYGFLLSDQPEKQFELASKALQLSPMSIYVNSYYAYQLLGFGKIADAHEVVKHMLTINTSRHLTYLVIYNIFIVEGRYAKALATVEAQTKISLMGLNSRFNVANAFATIGLGEKAASFVEGTSMDVFKYLYKGNKELFISQVREMFPRYENDSLGYWLRAFSETMTANYIEAAKYFRLTKFSDTDPLRIYSYQQTGMTEDAQELLVKAKLELKASTDSDIKFFEGAPVALRAMEIAYLEGDIEKAIVNLNKVMEENYIIATSYKVAPMYKKLREHSEWPTILAKSEKRAAIQRDKYLNLLAKSDKS